MAPQRYRYEYMESAFERDYLLEQGFKYVVYAEGDKYALQNLAMYGYDAIMLCRTKQARDRIVNILRELSREMHIRIEIVVYDVEADRVVVL